jgi:hypothetical protein
MTLIQSRPDFRPRFSRGWIPTVLSLAAVQFSPLSDSPRNLFRAGRYAVPDLSNEPKTLFDAEIKDFVNLYFHAPILIQPIRFEQGPGQSA